MWLTIIGLLGMSGILSAFVLEDFNKIKRGGRVYNLLNLFGALILLVYAFLNDDIVFIILNAFWLVIAFYFLFFRKE
ncbi:MAG: CBU_0592 family membrane protein [Nanobdellota archaeon]